MGAPCVVKGAVLYRFVARPFLYLLSAETAHHLIVRILRLAQVIPGVGALMALVFPVSAEAKRLTEVRALGLTFPGPVGLAAGFDKDAKVYRALGQLGFGFVEVGTVTGEGQAGNPLPRLFRLIQDRALVNRMGFNNLGAENAQARLATDRWLSSRRESVRGQGSPERPVIGINIGKTKLVSAEDATSDYEKSARLLGPHADYLVVNVSSPNTPGLRDLQAVASLRPILVAVRAALDTAVPDRQVPLLVKIAPDLSDEDVLAVADLAMELSLDGIIATNTTIARTNLKTDPSDVTAVGAGGLSGAPLKRRALEVIKLLRSRVGDQMVLVAAGGIESVEDAWARITAGATLVQVYSALVYEGPRLPSALTRGLAKETKRAGFANISQAVGTDRS